MKLSNIAKGLLIAIPFAVLPPARASVTFYTATYPLVKG